jgi:hypothetical protein
MVSVQVTHAPTRNKFNAETSGGYAFCRNGQSMFTTLCLQVTENRIKSCFSRFTKYMKWCINNIFRDQYLEGVSDRTYQRKVTMFHVLLTVNETYRAAVR